MRKVKSARLQSLHGQLTEWKALALDTSTDTPSVIEGYMEDDLNLKENDHQHLRSIVLISSSGNQIICCGSVNSLLKINDLKLILEFSEKSASLRKPYERTCLIQLVTADKDLEGIKNQEYQLLNISSTFSSHLTAAHLSIGAHPFFVIEESAFNRSSPLSASKLERLHNIAGLLQYCKWLNEEFKLLLKKIALDATDRFPLEASLKDFSHQTSSPMLMTCWQQLNDHLLHVGRQKFGNISPADALPVEKIVALERSGFELQIEMLTYLQTHWEITNVILDQLDKIELDQLELKRLSSIVRLFNSFLSIQIDLSGTRYSSTGQQLLQLCLLNHLLGIVPVFEGSDISRINICSSIATGCLQMIQMAGIEESINCALNWDDLCVHVNKTIATLGVDAYSELMNNKENASSFNKSAQWVNILRQCIYKNLHCIGEMHPSPLENRNKKVAVDTSYLNFLPHRYVSYHAASGLPTSLINTPKLPF